MDTERKQLVHRVARLEGQLAAVRAALVVDDCSKAARTLLAASRSLSSLRAVCVDSFMRTRVFRGARVRDNELLTDVEALLRA